MSTKLFPTTVIGSLPRLCQPWHTQGGFEGRHRGLLPWVRNDL